MTDLPVHHSFKIEINDPWRFPLIMTALHGGREIPNDMAHEFELGHSAMLATSDLWTDRLVEVEGAEMGFASMSAVYARTIVDLNRAPDLYDGSVVKNLKLKSDIYLKAGYGVIPKYAERGHQIRHRKLFPDEAQGLISDYHAPFHNALAGLILEAKKRFGRVLILDIHSAPSSAMRGADIVLGTNLGASVRGETLDLVVDVFERHFNHVWLDTPYSGGYLTCQYGKPELQVEVVQVEIDRRFIEAENRGFRQEFINLWGIVVEQFLEAVAKDFSHGEEY